MTRVRDQGRVVLRQWLTEQGWSSRELPQGKRVVLVATRGGARRTIRWSTKSSGTWQASINDRPFEDGDHPDCYWAFVDLSKTVPRVRVYPEHAVRSQIAREHTAYINSRGGHRPNNDASPHFGVKMSMIDTLDRVHRTTWN